MLILLHNPEISLSIIYPRVVKTYVHLKTCVQVFITALFSRSQKPETTLCQSPCHD